MRQIPVCPPLWLAPGHADGFADTPSGASTFAYAWSRHASRRGAARAQLGIVEHLQSMGVATAELNEKARELRSALGDVA